MYRAEIEASDSYGQQALHVASSAGHVPVVEFLLASRANVDDQNAEGQTALLVSKGAGPANVLLSWGASLEIRDASGTTPLYAAAHAGHLELQISTPRFHLDLSTVPPPVLVPRMRHDILSL